MPRATIAVLSGQPSCSRVPDASDASAVARGGSGAYWTCTASSASASRARLSATTTATGSPTWRTTSRARTGCAQKRPLGEPPYALGTLGVTAPRSAALQARATPGSRRAASVTTETRRAWASVLRATPRCRRPSRARSSRKRPPPVRSRSSPLRSGEEPISRRGIYHACSRSSWVDSRVMRAGDRRWTAWLQMTVLVPANLIGAIVSFTYFNFVDRLAPGRDEVLAGSVLFFLFGFGLL